MTAEARGPQVSALRCPEGPILVRGADEVVDEAGVVHPVTRPVVAVCRCDTSQRLPWCDGTHTAVGRPRRLRGAASEARSGRDGTWGEVLRDGPVLACATELPALGIRPGAVVGDPCQSGGHRSAVPGHRERPVDVGQQ